MGNDQNTEYSRKDETHSMDYKYADTDAKRVIYEELFQQPLVVIAFIYALFGGIILFFCASFILSAEIFSHEYFKSCLLDVERIFGGKNMTASREVERLCSEPRAYSIKVALVSFFIGSSLALIIPPIFAFRRIKKNLLEDGFKIKPTKNIGN